MPDTLHALHLSKAGVDKHAFERAAAAALRKKFVKAAKIALDNITARCQIYSDLIDSDMIRDKCFVSNASTVHTYGLSSK